MHLYKRTITLMSQRLSLDFATVKKIIQFVFLQQFSSIFIKFLDGYLSVSIVVMRIKCVAMAFSKWLTRKETCKLNPITSICVYLTKTRKGRINSLVNAGKICSTATITVTTKYVAGTISATGKATASSAIWTDSIAWTSTTIGIDHSYKSYRSSQENQCLQCNHCFSGFCCCSFSKYRGLKYSYLLRSSPLYSWCQNGEWSTSARAHIKRTRWRS